MNNLPSLRVNRSPFITLDDLDIIKLIFEEINKYLLNPKDKATRNKLAKDFEIVEIYFVKNHSTDDLNLFRESLTSLKTSIRRSDKSIKTGINACVEILIKLLESKELEPHIDSEEEAYEFMKILKEQMKQAMYSINIRLLKHSLNLLE